MKTLSFILFIIPWMAGVSQNIKYEWVNIRLYRPPLHPLSVNEKTFSVAVVDLGNQLGTQETENLQQNIDLPGFSRVRDNAVVKVEIVLSGAAITGKELKDKPRTVEKDGVKTVYHQYHYLLNCSFPTKLRLNIDGQYIEQDLPAFFQTKYYGTNSTHERAFNDEYERDGSFRRTMYREKLSDRIKEINTLLSSQYGYAVHPEHFSVGYVKDKTGEYADLARAMTLIRELLLAADAKEDYLDGTFTAKSAEAASILEKALSESSSDKKARINPKVTAMIHYNLALISFGLQKFDAVRKYLDEARKGSGGTYAEATSLLDKTADYEQRLLASHNAPSMPATDAVEAAPGRRSLPSVRGETYIIGKQNDTLKVDFIFPPSYEMPFGDSVWIQDQIIVEGDDKPATIVPEQIQGFCHDGVYYEALWWVDDVTVRPWTVAHKFCKQIVPGAIAVYSCYEVVTDDEGYKKVITSQYYKDDAEGYKRVMFLSFKRGVSKLVAGYPELSERVRNGEFTRDDFIPVVQTYNMYKESQKTPAP